MHLSPLYEGLRFGNREIKDVIRSNDILVGLEFEMHLNKEKVADEMRARGYDRIRDFMDERKSRIEMSYYNNIFFKRYGNGVNDKALEFLYSFGVDALKQAASMRIVTERSSFLSAMSELADSENPAEHPRFAYVEELLRERRMHENAFISVHRMWKDFSDLDEGAWESIVEITNKSANRTQIDKAGRYLHAVTFYLKGIAMMDGLTDITVQADAKQFKGALMASGSKINSGDRDVAMQVLDGIPRDAVDVINADFEKDFKEWYARNPRDVLADLYRINLDLWRDIDYKLKNGGAFRQEPWEVVTDMFQERDLAVKLGVARITAEVSVENGVEIITRPTPISEIPAQVAGIFEFMKEYGTTSEETGLHVNLSVRGKNMSDLFDDPATLLKLFFLIDERFILKGGTAKEIRNRKGRKVSSDFHNTTWSSREFVEPILEDNWRDILRFLHMENATSFDEIVDLIAGEIKDEEKYQGINFQHIWDFLNEDRRIEFRYMGGKGYENKLDTVVMHIMRFAYILKVAANPIFGRREFATKLMRELNKRVAEHWGSIGIRDYRTFMRTPRGELQI